MNNFFKKKQIIVFFVFCGLLLSTLIYRYGNLALRPLSAVSPSQDPIERGSIVDRSGFPLAVQTNFYHVGISTRNIYGNQKLQEAFAQNISDAIGMTPQQILTLLNTKKSFVYLKKKLTQTEYEAVRQITEDNKYNFVSYEKIPGRLYPNHALASQLIGYMGSDGRGLAGIEFSQQKILQPDLTEEVEGGAQPQGRNIYLSIDANLQYKLEQIAYKTMHDTQAESMMLIAADCRNGEILSYISLPSVDLNDYGESTEESRMDRPAMYSYEPGSVFKIFTVGIAYDQHGISPNDSFLCDGVYEKKLSSGERIRIKCLEHHGWCTPRDALRFSCNDALGQIADRIYDDDFIARIRQLGFGAKTGVELPGETAGLVKDPESRSWSARSKPTIAIGQEITVSALQMVQAASAIANGGVPVQLTFIHKITNKDGTTFYEHTPEYKSRNFSKATADYVLSCMETTATTGTGARANLRDVSIGVKTGTAQMADKVHGGYSTTDFLSNCISIFPIEDPQIVLYIVVTKAKGETYAGRIVAPVIAEAADVIIDHLGMSRESAASLEHSGVINIKQTKAVQLGSYLPDFTGLSKKDLIPLVSRNDIHFIINGSGWVTSQNPPAGTPLSKDMVIELNLE